MTTERFLAKREEILTNGLELLWTKGYNGTSVKDIVEAAGIPKGSFYQYFESKEAFCKAALQSMKGKAAEIHDQILLDSSLTPLEKVRKVYEVRIDMATTKFNCQKGCLFTTLTGEVSNSSESLRQTIIKAWVEMLDPLVQTVQEAIDAGEIGEDHNAKELTYFLEDAFRGALTATTACRQTKPFEVFMHYAFNKVLV